MVKAKLKKLLSNKFLVILILLQTGALEPLFGQMTWSVYNTDNTIMIENQINCLLVDENQGLWIGTNWGLYLKNGGQWQDFSDNIPNPQVRSLSLDNDGNLWVGTLSGLSIKNEEEWTTYNNQNSILNNQINDIVFSQENEAYIATIDGLFKYDSDFSLVLDSSSLENSFINVRSLAFKGDSLVVGTVNGGLGYLYNDSMIWHNTSNSGINDNTTIDLTIDNNENVWSAAPYGGLVSHLKNDSWLIYNTVENNQWPSNSLSALLFDVDQFLFVGSNGAGFFRFYYNNGIPNTEKYNSDNSPLPSDYVLCLAKDYTDYWIGTEQGLVRWGTSVSISELEKNTFIKENNRLIFSENHKVELYSITGQRVYSQNTSKLDLNSFKKGVYIVVYNSISKKVIVD
jgi:ligand-binding sensor domain-containing protein